MQKFGIVKVMSIATLGRVFIVMTISLLLSFWPKCIQARVNNLLELDGDLEGALYRIVVPQDWNGTLLVYARGTGQSFTVDGKVGLSPLVNVVGVDPIVSGQSAQILENKVLEQGYALAASAYRDQGLWVVQDGIHDTLALTLFFREKVGKPNRTILWSRSQGTLVALKSIEKFPEGVDIYDGVIAGCAVGAGAPRSWDSAVDLALAYDVTFGWPDAWGSVGDVRDDIKFNDEVVPVLLQNLLDTENFARFEFIRLVNKLPSYGFYPFDPVGYEYFNWLFADMLFATEVRAEVERKAKGPVAQNIDHFYSLTEQDKTYLSLLGMDNNTANALLSSMNARTNIEARKQARRYLERFADFSGEIYHPVLTMHTTVDGLVIPSHESAYQETVDISGRSDKLVQVFVDAVGHCTFTPDQWLAAVTAMDYWLDKGLRPDETFFPGEMGFDKNFVPMPWPQPPQTY
jgi:hypothetical protein